MPFGFTNALRRSRAGFHVVVAIIHVSQREARHGMPGRRARPQPQRSKGTERSLPPCGKLSSGRVVRGAGRQLQDGGVDGLRLLGRFG